MNIIDPKLTFNGNMSEGNDPNLIVLHHAEAKHCTVLDVHQWHLERGWAGIGYHYFVAKDGSIYKGRPDNVQGAHTAVRNWDSLGICAEGAYDYDYMLDVQKQAIIELCRYLKDKYPRIHEIVGHKELMATDCPGNNYPLYDIINASNEVPREPVAVAPERTWLQVGDMGDKVVDLQTKLTKLGFRCGGVDGDYGKMTKAAVMKFQSVLGLTSDGLTGSDTTTALEEILATPYCHYGATAHYAVRYIQYRVNAPADGRFGLLTAIAVKDFQQKHGLYPDGQVGPMTWRELLK